MTMNLWPHFFGPACKCIDARAYPSMAQTAHSDTTAGSVAEWLACWTQAQEGLGSNRSHRASVHHTHTHTRLTALFPGLPGTRKVKPIWILLKQETASGSGISWAICKSAPCSRQITTPATHHSVFYRPDALPAAQPTVSSSPISEKYSSPLKPSTVTAGLAVSNGSLPPGL